MNTFVKICGIRTVEAAITAVNAGADFLGVNFVPMSKRRIAVEQAETIINQLPKQVKTVGVFMNQPPEFVNYCVDLLGLNYVQLHGDETPEYCREIKGLSGIRGELGVIRVIGLGEDFDVEETIRQMREFDVNYFLLDRERQGQGKRIDLEKARVIAREFPIFLAGGLTPENVANAIETVHPYAVDVAGGIETGGKEDLEKIIRFIKTAKKIYE